MNMEALTKKLLRSWGINSDTKIENEVAEEEKLSVLANSESQELEDNVSTVQCSDEEYKSNIAYSSEDEEGKGSLYSQSGIKEGYVCKKQEHNLESSECSLGIQSMRIDINESNRVAILPENGITCIKGSSTTQEVLSAEGRLSQEAFVTIAEKLSIASETKKESTSEFAALPLLGTPRPVAKPAAPSIPVTEAGIRSHYAAASNTLFKHQPAVGTISLAEPESPFVPIQEPRLRLEGVPLIFQGLVRSAALEKHTKKAELRQETFIDFNGKWRLVKNAEAVPDPVSIYYFLEQDRRALPNRGVASAIHSYPLPCTYSFPKEETEEVTATTKSDSTTSLSLKRLMKIFMCQDSD